MGNIGHFISDCTPTEPFDSLVFIPCVCANLSTIVQKYCATTESHSCATPRYIFPDCLYAISPIRQYQFPPILTFFNSPTSRTGLWLFQTESRNFTGFPTLSTILYIFISTPPWKQLMALPTVFPYCWRFHVLKHNWSPCSGSPYPHSLMPSAIHRLPKTATFS